MSASRKLYVAVAEKFKEVERRTDENDRHMFRTTTFAAAKAMKDDNSGFDTLRFLAASGWKDDELRAIRPLL